MALGAAIAKACTWESPSGLKWNFKVGKQTGERSREAGYTEVILQGLPLTPRQTASALLLPNRTVCAVCSVNFWTSKLKCLRAIFSLKISDVKEKKCSVQDCFSFVFSLCQQGYSGCDSIFNNEFVSEDFFPYFALLLSPSALAFACISAD